VPNLHSQQPGPVAASWTPALLGCVLGAACQVTQAQLGPLWRYQALLALGCLGLIGVVWGPRRRGRLHRAQLCAAASAAALVFGMTGWRAHSFAAQALDPALEGRDIRVTGVVASMAQQISQGQRWLFAVEQARLAEGDAPIAAFPPLIELSWYLPYAQDAGAAAHMPPVRAGQRREWTVRLKRPHGARNPHGFDYELWQWERGVQATGYVRDKPPAQRMGAGMGAAGAPHGGASYWLQGQRQRMRDAIMAQVAHTAPWLQRLGLDGAQAQRMLGVVAALAVGDQQAIARADWQVFRRTGVAHLMSISGLHITLFAVLAVPLVGRLWRCSARACLWYPAQQAALLGGVLLAGSYALFSGWGLPAQRTVCMLAAVALLRCTGLRWPWPALWSLALATVVVFDPWALWQAGFWLSFVAVGVLLASDEAQQQQAGQAPPRPLWQRLWHPLARLWREQWRISLALAPLGLLLFGQLSPSGLLANLLAIPWVTFVVTPLALAGAIWPPLWSAAALALAPLMAVLYAVNEWSWAVFYPPQAPLWVALAAVLGALALVSPLPWAWRGWGAIVLLPALYWSPAAVPEGEFTLLAADIGQGNAVLLQTARHTLLYDSGPGYSAESNAGERVLVPLLQALGVRLDALWLSHRDNDHTGGALALRSAHPQAEIWGSDSVIADAALAALGPVRRCQAGQRWDWDGVRFQVLNPPALAIQPAQALRRANENSCVLLVRSASGRAALLGGDITAAQERALVRAGALVPLDWLLVPHHGSRTSSSRALLQATTPRWAVVQAGYRNRYGHPAPDVLHRYAAFGSSVVQQAHCGAAHWSSQRPQHIVCERLRQRRYWDVHGVPLQ